MKEWEDKPKPMRFKFYLGQEVRPKWGLPHVVVARSVSETVSGFELSYVVARGDSREAPVYKTFIEEMLEEIK
jgi:hypothetical protein